MKGVLGLLGIAFLSAGALAGEYEASVEAYRNEREARLRAEGGWLSVAGLFWLKDGPNRFGTASSNEIVLPEGSAPPEAGALHLDGDRATVRVSDGVDARLGSARLAGTAEMRPDAEGGERLTLGRLSLQLIRRQDRFAVRLRDEESEALRAFTGLVWYPVSPAWRITARFTPHVPERSLRIATVIGTTVIQQSPGFVTFSVGGREVTLDAVVEDAQEPKLFFMFRDETSGKETYGAGRFLYTDLPVDDSVILDFNKAQNPPCAFTPYATCPLPPRQNWLEAAIAAGEKAYRGPGHE